MGNRVSGKTHAGIEVKFLFGSKVYSGTILNLSRKHILICSEPRLTADFKGEVDLLILYKGKRLIVPVRIRKLAPKNIYYNLITVEVLTPPVEYFELIDNAMPEYKQYSIHTTRLLKKEHPGTIQ